MTNPELEAEFKAELGALLKKYGATLSAEDHYNGYPECGEDVRMTVDIPTIWEDGEVIRNGVEIDLGTYLD